MTDRRAFLETYRRATLAIGSAVAQWEFEDRAWVANWGRAFVGSFLAAHDADLAGAVIPRPWRLAFGAPPRPCWSACCLNRRSSQRFLRQPRRSAWHNALELNVARQVGPGAYQSRLDELEVLASAKITDLLRPGQVLLWLAVVGFGIHLPPR